jgi:CRISPR/Cas system CSM-associated protein Csm3 (group 7 of RAMP superfamily)
MRALFSPAFKDCPIRSVARITVELTTPLHVGTGRREDESDAGFVRDASGLPLIPGSSIAGRLRRLLGAHDASRPSSFGHQKENSGFGSRLIISNAVIHDHTGTPRDGVVSSAEIKKDDILHAAVTPTLRDHVRLNERGTAAHRGKFDDLSVCAGHRFTFEIEFIQADTDEDHGHWQLLLSAFASPHFRLGGRTRRSFGGLRLHAISQASWDLRCPEAFAAYAALPASLREPATGLSRSEIEATGGTFPVGSFASFPQRQYTGPKPPSSILSTEVEDLTLTLTPQDFWMFGGGSDPDADASPVHDRLIVWPENGSPPRVESRWVIPFSGVKGALSHRTLFHARIRAGAWAGETDADAERAEASALASHRSIFGCVKTVHVESSACGRLFGDDVWLGPVEASGFLEPERLQHHVAIDRLTGGASDTALFSDKPLFQSRESASGETITIPLFLENPPASSSAELGDHFRAGRAALVEALRDVQEGRLALGGLTGRGYGRFAAPPSNP